MKFGSCSNVNKFNSMDNKASNKKSVAATVIVYNSEKEVLTNIDTYVNQVDKIYVIDNSEQIIDKLISLIQCEPKVEYHWMKGNKGIAAALSKAAQLATDAGYDYLLMMDDDSQLTGNTVMDMSNYIAQYEFPERIGIVTAQSDPNIRSNLAHSVWYTITSGSLLNLKAYQYCGPFMEELFIDGVDHEYCYRLRKFNYEIIILNYVFMSHQMGSAQELKIFNKVIYKWSSHSPLRNYYLVRNFLFILNRYKVLVPACIRFEVYYGVAKACLLDLLLGENKLLRLRYMGKAISDFRSHRLGKLTQTLD